MSDLYAHQKRAQKRKEISTAIKQKASAIITELLDKQPLSAADAQAFYLKVDDIFRSEFKTRSNYLLARITLTHDIQKLNELRHDPLPVPEKPIPLKRAMPCKRSDWLIEGQIVAEYASQALSLWTTQKEYSYNDALAWTVFSAILWGGLNDIHVVRSFLYTLVDRQPQLILEHDLLIIPLEISDQRYGNIYIKENDSLFRSFMFIPDSLTLCWMVHLQKFHPEENAPPLTLEDAFALIFKSLQINFTSITFAKHIHHLLNYASYHWEQLADIQIDQALARVMTGLQNCCSLSNSEFEIFNAPKIEIPHNITLSLPQLLKGVIPSHLPSQHAEPPKKLARDVTRDIRQALNSKDIQGSFDHLIELYDEDRIIRLLKWISHLYHAEAKETLKKNSVIRYLDAVAHPWLIHTFEEELSTYEAFDFETLYQEILDGLTTSQKRSFIAPLLGRFHKFQIDQFAAPPTSIPSGFETRKHVTARVISPRLYQYLLLSIEKATSISPHDQQIFRLLIILAYRTGMRREELVKLQFRDIERGAEISFIIRASAAGSIKTASAQRRIPVWALLKSEELNELRRFLNHVYNKTKKDTAIVFTTANASFKLPKEVPSRLLSSLLEQIMPNHHYTFHSFRHTTLSNLAVILTARESLISLLTDYTPEECIRIRTALLGHEHSGQDRWFGLAQVAGHIDPQHSFESYIHFAQIIASHEISQATILLPFQIFHNITHISTKKTADWAPDSFDKNLKCVNLRLLRVALSKKLHTYSYKKNALSSLTHISLSKDEEHKKLFIHSLFDLLPDGNYSHLSFKDVHQMLQEVEKGMPIELSAEKRQIPFELASQWLDRAQQLAQLMTQRKKSLLISKPRLEENPKVISPAMPTTRKELELVEQMIHQLPALLRETPEKIHIFLNIFFDKTSTSISEIRFKKHEDYKLNFFLYTGSQLISISRWRLKAPSLAEARQLKKNFELSDTLSIDQDEYQGYSLSIINPLEKQKSSGILKYFCHMLAIVDPTYVIQTPDLN